MGNAAVKHALVNSDTLAGEFCETLNLSDTFNGLLNCGYQAYAVSFDGTNDYLLKTGSPAGVVNGKNVICSFWANIAGGNGLAQRIIGSSFDSVIVRRDVLNKFQIKLKNISGVTVFDVKTITNITDSSGWVHILITCDLNDPSGSIYVNGVKDTLQLTLTNDTIDHLYSGGDVSVGAFKTGITKLNGCLSEFYYNVVDTVSESDNTISQVNIEKFIKDGKPVDLGSDGSTPTGSQPLIYLSNAYNSFELNNGSGDDFTVIGALESCGSDPGV